MSGNEQPIDPARMEEVLQRYRDLKTAHADQKLNQFLDDLQQEPEEIRAAVRKLITPGDQIENDEEDTIFGEKLEDRDEMEMELNDPAFPDK